ncbi:glycosyltransferase family 4 protein [Neobacillus sp. 179-J 1A1 HS]|uniref:glycosyltransferase family 4 protein n=1 Tax=Neobacillus driksii TaxID=3035913 RepID=UPI0035BC8D80
MKILITSITYPGKIGVSTYIQQLIQGLKSQGHLVDVFSHNPLIKNPTKQMTPKTQVAVYRAAAAHLSFEKYDIIHSQGIIPTVAISQLRPKNVPLISSLHGTLAFNMLMNGALKKNTPAWREMLNIESRAITSSDICIVASHWLKNVFLTQYKIQKNQPFHIVPYGINTKEFFQKMEIPPPITKPKNKFILVCTARLIPLKGHLFLLDALAKLKQQRQDWVFWIIGDGPLRIQLTQKANRLGLGGYVQFLGNQENVPALLKEADLFVFPSLQDNMPYAVMEAQLAGIPVSVSDAGGIPEMVKNGDTGFVSPRKDSHTLYLNIKKLMENKPLRDSMSKNGWKWAFENWSIEKMIQNTLAVYHQALLKGGNKQE